MSLLDIFLRTKAVRYILTYGCNENHEAPKRGVIKAEEAQGREGGHAAALCHHSLASPVLPR